MSRLRKGSYEEHIRQTDLRDLLQEQYEIWKLRGDNNEDDLLNRMTIMAIVKLCHKGLCPKKDPDRPVRLEWQSGTLPNGKRVAYHAQTVFLIQVGARKKDGYTTTYKIRGDLNEAIRCYENTRAACKKRLFMPDAGRKAVLLKEIT